MIKNKYIIAPILFLAWTIIFVHNIVPHHHHFADQSSECHHESHRESASHSTINVVSQFDCCNDHETEYTCHFHVEILTQVSIDNVFINHTENSLFSDINDLEKQLVSYYQEFIPYQIPQKYYLRGPPQIS